MGTFIPRETEIKADRLLKEGKTIRETADTLGINRGTVARIRKAGGPRPPDAPPPPQDELFAKVKKYWCKGCGAWVLLQPCVGCWAREWNEKRGG